MLEQDIDVRLVSFTYDSNLGITPLNLGYLNAVLRERGYNSRIESFEREESICRGVIQSMDFFGVRCPQWNFARRTEKFELVSNEIFAETLDFIDRGNSGIVDEYPSQTKKILKTLDRMATRLSKSDVVGLSFSLGGRLASGVNFYLSKKIREENDSVKIIWGGPMTDMFVWFMNPSNVFYRRLHETMIKHGILDKFKFFLSQHVDYLVHGEGELTLPDILSKIKSKRKSNKITGATVIGNGRFYFNEERGLAQLDSLPFPDFTGLDLRHYYSIGFSLSRGCIHNCNFCDDKVIWKIYRSRNPQNVVDEIEYQMDRYKKRSFFACDLCLNGNRKALMGLCNKIIERGLSVDWGGSLTFNESDKKLIKLMRDSGFTRPRFGLESLDKQSLDFLNKTHDISRSIDLLKFSTSIGMRPTIYVMLGHIGRSLDSHLHELDGIRRIRRYYKTLVFSIFDMGSRSRVCESPERFGFKFVHKPVLDKKVWEEYSVAHSYAPGVFTYLKNGLNRGETDFLIEEYVKNNLSFNYDTMLYNLNKFGVNPDSLMRHIPYVIKNSIRKGILSKAVGN